MDGKKINQLVEVKELMGAEVLPCSFSGTTRRVTIDTVKDYILNQPCLAFTTAEYNNPAGTDRGDGLHSYVLKVDNPGIFAAGDVVLFPSIKGIDVNKEEAGCIMAIVIGLPTDGGIEISPCNGPTARNMTGDYTSLPKIPKYTPVLRIGKSFYACEQDGRHLTLPIEQWHNSKDWE